MRNYNPTPTDPDYINEDHEGPGGESEYGPL